MDHSLCHSAAVPPPRGADRPLAGPAPAIKIFGERNTATNALAVLIRLNSDSRLLPCGARDLAPGIGLGLSILGRMGCSAAIREWLIDRAFRGRPGPSAWKHAATWFDDPGLFAGSHVVFCLRHPASWVLGLFRRPYHLPGPRAATLGAFLDRRWRTVERERLDRRSFDPVGLYNAKARSYLALIDALEARGIGYSIVRHEEITTAQAAVVARLRPHLVAPRPALVPLRASTKERGKGLDDYARYYGEERWRAEIDPESHERIAASVDWAAFARLGYRADEPPHGRS